jgi:hypothetical protein
VCALLKKCAHARTMAPAEWYYMFVHEKTMMFWSTVYNEPFHWPFNFEHKIFCCYIKKVCSVKIHKHIYLSFWLVHLISWRERFSKPLHLMEKVYLHLECLTFMFSFIMGASKHNSGTPIKGPLIVTRSLPNFPLVHI